MLPSNIKNGIVNFNNINKNNSNIVWSLIPNTVVINPINNIVERDFDNKDNENIYSLIEKKAT